MFIKELKPEDSSDGLNALLLGCSIQSSEVFENAKICKNVRINECTIKEKASIGYDVHLAYCSIVSWTEIARRCVISYSNIGDGAVIGANSVVTKDVPPYAVVAGVPARIIRYRFPPDIVKRLLDLRWWNYPRSILLKYRDCFIVDLTEEKLNRLEAIKKEKVDK